jgi:Na+/glutamate symporter
MLTFLTFSFGLVIGVVIGLVWAKVLVDRPHTELADQSAARFRDWL